MFLRGWLALLLAVIPATLTINPGVKVKVTQKGLEYGRQLGMVAIQQKLKNIKIPDFSGKQRVKIGKVKYSFSNIRILNVGLPTSAVTLVPGTGIRLSISNAFISLHGNWRVKFLRIIRKSGSLDLNVSGVSIATTMAVRNDGKGRPAISSVNCVANVDRVKVKFRGGLSWLYNLFDSAINRALRKAMEKQMCPLVNSAVSDLNPELQTLNVLARVDKHAEIEYSMVSSPAVSTSALELSLKGEFYNIGRHQEPPFTPAAFSLPPQANNMVYMGVSAYSLNSAAFVYNRAGILSVDVTDNMIPRGIPVRLNTATFGVLIPQIAQRFPGLLMKLQVKTSKSPVVTFQPNNLTIEAAGTVTAFAIQRSGTLSPLFVLNLDTSVSTRVFLNGMRLAGSVSLNKMELTLGSSNVGQFKVTSVNSILQVVLNAVVIPIVNVQLAKGYPLPALGKMKLVNPQLQVLKDYMLIGTDVQFNL